MVHFSDINIKKRKKGFGISCFLTALPHRMFSFFFFKLKGHGFQKIEIKDEDGKKNFFGTLQQKEPF